MNTMDQLNLNDKNMELAKKIYFSGIKDAYTIAEKLNCPPQHVKNWIEWGKWDQGENSNGNKHKEDDGGCYIATACYGSYTHPDVIILREFRDNFLLKNYLGILFVRFYYRFSPYFAKKLKTWNNINKYVKFYVLTPLVRFIDHKSKH